MKVALDEAGESNLGCLLYVKIFLGILLGILLEGIAFEYLDVVGKTDIEAADALHAADVGGEVPDVGVALVGSDAVLGSRVLFYQKVLGHQVEL